MASQPPVVCPLCHEEMHRDRQLVDHLVEDHDQRDLATAIVSRAEASLEGDNA